MPTKQKADNFNRLVFDIYEHSMTVSKIIEQSDHGDEIVKRLRKNGTLLDRLFDQIEAKLYEILHAKYPSMNPAVLNIWYGLSTDRDATHQAIAKELNISKDSVSETRTAYLKHLRSPGTIAALEQIIRQAAHQAST